MDTFAKFYAATLRTSRRQYSREGVLIPRAALYHAARFAARQMFDNVIAQRQKRLRAVKLRSNQSVAVRSVYSEWGAHEIETVRAMLKAKLLRPNRAVQKALPKKLKA